jgi:hypothetical protein
MTAALNGTSIDDALVHSTMTLANGLGQRCQNVLLPVPRLLASNPATAQPSQTLSASQTRTLHPGWVNRSTRWVFGRPASNSQVVSRTADGYAVQHITVVGDTLDTVVFGTLMDAVTALETSPAKPAKLFDQNNAI